MLEINVGNNSIKIPAFITPGQNQKQLLLNWVMEESLVVESEMK